MMVLYGVTLVPLAEELRAADPGLLFPFYAGDSAFGGSERSSTQLITMLIKRRSYRGYFPKPGKFLLFRIHLIRRKRLRGGLRRKG